MPQNNQNVTGLRNSKFWCSNIMVTWFVLLHLVQVTGADSEPETSYSG